MKEVEDKIPTYNEVYEIIRGMKVVDDNIADEMAKLITNRIENKIESEQDIDDKMGELGL